MFSLRRHALAVSLALLSVSISSPAQSAQKPATPPSEVGSQYTPRPQPAVLPNTRAAMLRGAYGPYRANNDLLSYHLDIRVDPEKQIISGKNTIRFRMLEDGNRIQLDLNDALKIDKILLGATELKYERDSGAVFIDFPDTLKNGQEYSIDFYYSGRPLTTGTVRRLYLRQGPGWQAVDLHLLRGRRRQHLVAE